jgi:transcriptional regulator MraZ
MRHPVLFGEFELNIDDKNRLLIPSEVRRSIDPAEHGDGFFLVIGINRLPWLYPSGYYERLVTQAPADITPEQDLLAFDQLHFALASRLEPDKQGRVLLPDKILRRAGVRKEVTLIGARDHLELWNRADWEARREELEQRGPEIAVAAKRHRQSQDPERPAKPVV